MILLFIHTCRTIQDSEWWKLALLSLLARWYLRLAVQNGRLWLPNLVSAFTSKFLINLVLEGLNLGAL